MGVDNVGSKQMQQIRASLRDNADVLMGKNTMMRKALRGHLDKNPAIEKWVLGAIPNLFEHTCPFTCVPEISFGICLHI